MAPPRLSDEQKALSRQRRRDRRRELQRLRRADPEYRLAERARNTRARREQRNDPEYRKKERERDTRAHRERRNKVDTVMRNIAGCLWTDGNDEGGSDVVAVKKQKIVYPFGHRPPPLPPPALLEIPAGGQRRSYLCYVQRVGVKKNQKYSRIIDRRFSGLYETDNVPSKNAARAVDEERLLKTCL